MLESLGEECCFRQKIFSLVHAHQRPAITSPADYMLHIKAAPIEIAPKRIVFRLSLTTGNFPGHCCDSRKGGW